MIFNPVLSLAQLIHNKGNFILGDTLFIHEIPFRTSGIALVQRAQRIGLNGRESTSIISIYGKENSGSSIHNRMLELLNDFVCNKICVLPAYNICNCQYVDDIPAIMVIETGIEDLGRDDNDYNLYRFEVMLTHTIC